MLIIILNAQRPGAHATNLGGQRQATDAGVFVSGSVHSSSRALGYLGRTEPLDEQYHKTPLKALPKSRKGSDLMMLAYPGRY